MKTNRNWRIESGGGAARSVLDGGGKRSATPLSPETGTQANEVNGVRLRRFVCSLLLKALVQKRRRRCALPAHSKIGRTIAPALFLFFAANVVHAQNYSIDWHTIDGGGGTSTGGVYSISGSIGQPDAGSMSGGSYSLVDGFWGIVSVIQTLEAPMLTIRRRQTNTVIVSWPPPSTGFTLQQNSSLDSPNWVLPAETVSTDGTNNFIIVNPPIGNRFYRLFKP